MRKISKAKNLAPEGLTVLSLFDGISCGQYSLRSSGHKIKKYYASEIEKSAIACTMANYPDTVQLGDVTKIDLDALPKIDLLIGGSPCQGFSLSGKQKAFDDPRSKLFFEYVKIYRYLRAKNPKLKFLLENVNMQKIHLDVISKYLEVMPVYIDSKIFSAQSRKRWYWTNIPLDEFPEPSKLMLFDVLEEGLPYYGGDVFPHRTMKKDGTLDKDFLQNRKVKTLYGKSPTITKSQNAVNIPISLTKSRKASPLELERLAGLPDNYTLNCGSNNQRLNAVGNGWECNAIKFLFKNI